MAWVQTPTNRLVLHFVDVSGKHALSEYFVATTETDPAAGGAAAIAAGAQGISNDFLSSQELIVHAVNSAPGTPIDGPYCRGADKAQVILRTTTGVPVTLQIGAPRATVFTSGKIDLDPANADVIALIAAMVAHASDAEGNAIVGMQRGYRRRPPRRKHQ